MAMEFKQGFVDRVPSGMYKAETQVDINGDIWDASFGGSAYVQLVLKNSGRGIRYTHRDSPDPLTLPPREAISVSTVDEEGYWGPSARWDIEEFAEEFPQFMQAIRSLCYTHHRIDLSNIEREQRLHEEEAIAHKNEMRELLRLPESALVDKKETPQKKSTVGRLLGRDS